MRYDEITAGGIPVYNHERRPVTEEPTMSRGDPALVAAMHEHLDRCFPGVDVMALHEIHSPTVHLDVMLVPPTEDHPWLRLVTCGMAELPMHVPPGWSATPFAELTMALPPDWPVSMAAYREARFFWPVNVLKSLARMPHESDTFLWPGHTAHGDPDRPYAPDTRLCASLIVPPASAPPEFAELTVPGDDRSIRIFGVLPLYTEELEIKLQHGQRALMDLIEAAGLTDVVDPRRRSLVRLRGGAARLAGRAPSSRGPRASSARGRSSRGPGRGRRGSAG